MIVIDATNLILGRLAAYAAKRALLGEDVKIVNCEKAVTVGKPSNTIEDYLQKRRRGTHVKGPFYSKMADRLVRRTVRGMLPRKTARGKAAWERVMCYVGLPDEFKNEKLHTLERANIANTHNVHYLSMAELCKALGRKS